MELVYVIVITLWFLLAAFMYRFLLKKEYAQYGVDYQHAAPPAGKQGKGGAL